MLEKRCGEQCFLSWWMKRLFNKFMLPRSSGHGNPNIISCQVVFKKNRSLVDNFIDFKNKRKTVIPKKAITFLF